MRLSRGRDDDFLASHFLGPDDLRVLRRPGEPAAGTRARVDERLEAEPQAEAVARHRYRVYRRRLAFLARGDIADHARVQAERRHDALAVAQLEQLLDRLPVAGRRRHIDDP